MSKIHLFQLAKKRPIKFILQPIWHVGIALVELKRHARANGLQVSPQNHPSEIRKQQIAANANQQDRQDAIDESQSRLS